VSGRRGRCVCVAVIGTPQNTQSLQPGLHHRISLIGPILRSTVPVPALTIAPFCAFSTHTCVYVEGNSQASTKIPFVPSLHTLVCT
jgi:hypothetical protein